MTTVVIERTEIYMNKWKTLDYKSFRFKFMAWIYCLPFLTTHMIEGLDGMIYIQRARIV